jgi:putative endonuclease
MIDNWSVYIIRCKDRTLYTGISTDVSRRLDQHQRGKKAGAKYLRGRGPLTLVLQKRVGTKKLALAVEIKIKNLSRVQKEKLVCEPGLIEEIIGANISV